MPSSQGSQGIRRDRSFILRVGKPGVAGPSPPRLGGHGKRGAAGGSQIASLEVTQRPQLILKLGIDNPLSRDLPALREVPLNLEK